MLYTKLKHALTVEYHIQAADFWMIVLRISHKFEGIFFRCVKYAFARMSTHIDKAKHLINE